MRYLLQMVMLFLLGTVSAQYGEIPIANPSFEGNPAAGKDSSGFVLGGWFDCAPYYFKGQTPPDVQNGSLGVFDVVTKAQHEHTYLGMVVRKNETWELVSQRLFQALEKGNCYEFSINLARSDAYFSKLAYQKDTTKRYNFNKPIVLRIWGGRNVYEKRELLAESPVISHTEWQNYNFEFNVKQNHDYLILEAFYKTPTLLPYNGNILLDNASAIVRISCPGEEEIAVVAVEKDLQAKAKGKDKVANRVASGFKKQKRNTRIEKNENPQKKEVPKRHMNRSRILTDLDNTKLREGQIIKIEQLYFNADSSSFTISSFHVLDEIYDFLTQNPSVVIEIGGHTNGIPGQAYCKSLSLKRAKAVAAYLYNKGVPHDRIVYRGYGKLRPVASNKTYLGRQKNQRVEIKILSIS